MRITNMPDSLHLRFKLLCVKSKRTLNGTVIALIEEYVEREEKQK